MRRDSFGCTDTEEHCRFCGRALVATSEPGLFDQATGEREQDVWHSCPRYLCWSWQAAFIPGYGMGHESHSAENRLLGRTWR